MEQFVEAKDGETIIHGMLLADKLHQMVKEAGEAGNTHPVLVMSHAQYIGMRAKVRDGLDKVVLDKLPERKTNDPMTGASFNKVAIIVTANGELDLPVIL